MTSEMKTATEAVVKQDIKLTRRSSAAEKNAANLQKELEKNTRAATEAMAAEEPVDPSKISKSENNYSFKKADGSADKTTYAAERGAGKTAVDEVVDFLDKGTITRGVQEKIFNGVIHINDVQDILKSMLPVGWKVGDPLPATLSTELEGSIRKIAENPAYRAQLRDSLNGGLDSSITSLGEGLGAKERALAEAERLRLAKENELKELNDPVTGKLQPSKDRLAKEFTPALVGAPPTKADTIASLEATNGTTVRELARLNSDQERDNREIGDLRAQLVEAKATSAPPATIAALDRGISLLETGIKDRETAEIAPRQSRVDELTSLRQEKADLEGTIAELPAKIEQARLDLTSLTEAKFAAQGDKEQADLVFKDAVEGRVKMFQGMMGKEAAKFIRAEIIHAEGVERTRLSTAAAEAEAAGDKVKADLLISLEKRWDTDKPKGHRIKRWETPEIRTAPDKGKVQPDYDELLANGPDAFVRRLFVNPDGTTRKNPETGRNYTRTEIAEKMNDPAFVSSVGAEAIHIVLGKALRLGMINKDNDAIKIMQTSWGKEALDRAREWNKGVDEDLKKFEKTHNIPAGKIFEEVKKHPKMASLLLLTLFMPGAGFMVGGIWLGRSVLGKAAEHKKAG